MNLLKYPVPSTIQVGGIFYNINTNYDIALRIFDLFRETVFTERQKADIALNMLYGETIPPDRELALAKLYAYLNMDEDILCEINLFDREEQTSCATAVRDEPIIDFENDGNAIYSHFWRVYGIDLQEQPLHWWKFRVLLDDLSEKTTIQNLVSLRTTNLKDVPEEKRAEVARLKREYAVNTNHDKIKQQPMTLEERNRLWKEGK